MTTLRTSALAIVTFAVAIAAVACSSGTTDSTSGGTSGGTSSGTATSGGTSSGAATSSGSSSTNCQKISSCLNGSCKCGSGPNKDKSCQKDTAADADFCDTYCQFCM